MRRCHDCRRGPRRHRSPRSLLARAGARVRIVDRADVSARQSCAATRSTRARWRSCGGWASTRRRIERRACRVDGMIVTGRARRRRSRAATRRPVAGVAIGRRDLDSALLAQRRRRQACAVRAGSLRCARRSSTAGTARRSSPSDCVGATARTPAAAAPALVIAAGRPAVARSRSGARSRAPSGRGRGAGRSAPAASRTGSDADLHAGRDARPPRRYIGVAPLPDGLSNACLVADLDRADADLRDPSQRC